MKRNDIKSFSLYRETYGKKNTMAVRPWMIMKTIGQLLRDARQRQGLSIQGLSEETKIRPDFITAIESDNFSHLPSATFVKGFIQNLATALSLDPQTALAVFRRDFDQNQHGKIIPRGLSEPLQTPSRLYSPRTTTIIIALFVVLLVGLYALKQIMNLTQAPSIELTSPQEAEITPPIVLVQGKTASDATITVNQKPVSLKLDGTFEITINLSAGDHTIVIESSSRDGKTRTLERHIQVQP